MTKNKKNIWHKNTEEPEENKQVLVCFDNKFCYVCFYHKDEYRFYKEGKPSFPLQSITKWMYVDELL